MITFKEYLNERFITTTNVDVKKKHLDAAYKALHASYQPAGGYGGLKSGSPEERDAIHADILHPDHIMKVRTMGGVLKAVTIAKQQHGRKGIAIGSAHMMHPDGSLQKDEHGKYIPDPHGKTAARNLMKDDADSKIGKERSSWGEVSGAPEAARRKLNSPVVPNTKAAELTGKKIIRLHPDGEHYDRNIGGESHTKVIVGYPNKNHPRFDKKT